MTLAILVFNFYPVTAVMIVMIAVLNDGPFSLSRMTMFITATGPRSGICAWCSGSRRCWALSESVAAFGLFYLPSAYFHSRRAHAQTLST